VNGNKWINGSAVWTWDALQKTWIQSGNSILNASFYSEGNISITGNFGSSLNPAEVTFIAEGSIYNQGKQYMSPKYQNFSLVAGMDLRITGKLNTEADDLETGGISYAHHQINFSGTPTLRGPVIAANQADTVSPGGTNFVPLISGFMSISGNPTIIVDSITPGGVKTLSWREVRQ
jgi:hypothetical protein